MCSVEVVEQAHREGAEDADPDSIFCRSASLSRGLPPLLSTSRCFLMLHYFLPPLAVLGLTLGLFLCCWVAPRP